MIAHLVLFKFKPGVAAADARVRAAIEGLERLPSRVPGITRWEHGPNITDDLQAYDYGLRALFEDEAALYAYFEHPEHVPVQRQWEGVSELVFCDFRI